MVDKAILASSLLSGNQVSFLLLFYTDPGTGALLWQLMVASLIGGAFYARRVMRLVKSRIGGRRRNDSPYEEPLIDRSPAIK
jgi:hypothetical protein